MAETHFIWWGSDGTKHETPITYFRTTGRGRLVPHDKLGEYRIEDTSIRCPDGQEQALDPAKGL